MTLEKAKKTPAGGVLVGKREGQTMIYDDATVGGYFVGKLHKEGGIKGINKTTGQPIEVQSSEVIITAPAVADQTKREFEGQMLTNREILSKINVSGGGVSFEQGGDVPSELYFNGSSYNYGGKTMTDYEIMQAMNGCGCDEEYKNGGNVTDYQKKIADLKRENKSTFPKVPTNKIFFNQVEVLPASVVSTADPYLEDETKLPTESVDLKSIVPSQRNVTIPNIESTKDVESYPILFKLNDKYYVLDGHHRITNAILKDEKEVMAYVYDYKAQNLEFGGLSKGKSVEDIANMHNVSVSEINSQLKKGIKVESEHTSDKKLAEKIAKDHLVENPNYYTILDKVGLSDGGEIENNKKFINWFVGWYKDAVYKKMNIIMSIPFFDYNYGVDNVNKNNVVVLDIFEKKDQKIDAKKYLKEICDKADDYGVIIFLEPEPRFNYIQDNESKKQKITKEYLINYYSKFDFEKIKNKEFLIRLPKNKNKIFNNGGQLDLVEESKKGDHPSRDLNNYNDIMDLGADGEVGIENGLAFADGGELSYAGGGATLSAEVFEWDKVPTNYRNITKVKKVPFTNNPMDKGLDSIISPFLGKDELRPVGMGINFDNNGITATDFHKLITLPYPNEKYEGIYDINRVKKIKADQPILIDGNYPNYEAIIPKSNIIAPYEVDVYKLLQYTKTAINYANKITRGISFKFGDNERIGFNGSLLSEVLTASLKLGHEKLYAFITAPNRAMVLSPNKNYEVGNDDILLIMPIMLTSTFGTITGYGAEDIDYKRSLKAYFDFNDSEIHNADGSVAEFKMQYENNLSVDDNYLGLLNKITSKNQKLAILNYVKVENSKMTATDLDISLIVKDVNMPNGIYEIVNKAPNITMNPIEDFPKLPIFKSNEVVVNHNGSKPTAFEFVTFSEVFEFYLDKLLLSVGKDNLRPTMSGICIKKTSDNELFLVTTNAHTLCKINITEYCEFDKDDRELEYILPVKYLNDFVKLADGSLHFKCSKANIFIESDNLEYIGRTIDGKYPNYDAVIPRDNTKKIVFDHVAMNKCLKSPEVANQVAKYKGDKDIVFTLSNEGNNLFLKVQKDKGYNAPFEFIDKIQLCEIDFNYQQVDTNISLDKSVFLLMPFKDEFKENQYFAFRKDFFEVMLNTITDTEVECYFSEYFRAYIFPIDAIDYKKTLPEEKTKQQPKKVAKAKKEAVNVEKEQVREAIETLLMLAELEQDEQQRKEIYEALEVINMLKEESFESGGMMSRKLTFEPIRTPLN